MEKPLAKPKVIKLSELPQKIKSLEFLVNTNQQKIIDEKKLSVDAGNLVAKIYHELTNAYAQGRGVDIDDPKIQRSLNMLIVRLVFLLYADDSNLFGKDNIFQNFIERREPRDIRRDLAELFKVLDQPVNERDPYLDDEFNQFDYVNGGMFSDENIIIPQFTDELKRLIVEEAGAGFDWSGISPTIFGAVFESTLNPETRRSGGMHYTSIENIHKVIDPLFLNDLHDEFDKIQNMGNINQRIIKAREFREKLGKLKFFDPACGSGNFLTETYLSLRKMENECLRIITGDQGTLAITDDSDPKVKIQNLYGIEINDFAVSVARTAMWIAESQMWEQTRDITFANKDFLPLDSNDSIYEGNALCMDWNEIVKPYELDYIMGNPPFVGKKYQSKSQKKDLLDVFGTKFKGVGSLDYVTGWFEKAATFIGNATNKVAFVSTNSITQGEIVGILWEHLINDYGININFAYRTFAWQNEANNEAAVYCVIIGFSKVNQKDKVIYDLNGEVINTNNISPYLVPGDNMIVKRSNKVLQPGAPKMTAPNKPVDYNTLKLTQEEKDKMVKECPESEKWIKDMVGAQELIKGIKRYCLWLVGITPNELRSMSPVMKRVEACRQARIEHGTPESLRLAKTPTLFREQLNPKDYLAIPAVSSEKRNYIPMDYLHEDKIPVMGILIIPNADKFLFGLLESFTHMAWMKAIAGRLEMRYRYSKNIVYNTFPWPSIDEQQKQKIAETAQRILDTRKLYPDSSLADLYDPLTMPVELRKAHEANDKVVLKAYGLKPSASEPEIVQHLFKMYEQLVNDQK